MNIHRHSFDGKWPFRDAENTAVFCCEHVFAGDPILYVTHDHDGDWQFLCGASHEGQKPKLVSLGCLVEQDASLWPLWDLSIGWGADRTDQSSGWSRAPSPESGDD